MYTLEAGFLEAGAHSERLSLRLHSVLKSRRPHNSKKVVCPTFRKKWVTKFFGRARHTVRQSTRLQRFEVDLHDFTRPSSRSTEKRKTFSFPFIIILCFRRSIAETQTIRPETPPQVHTFRRWLADFELSSLL